MSGGSNQRTLFQTWGVSVSQNKHVQQGKGGKKNAEVRKPTSSNIAQVAKRRPPQNPLWTEIGKETHAPKNPARTEDAIPEFEDDDDDDLMVVAVYEAEKSLQVDNANFFQDENNVVAENAALSSTSSGGQIYPDFPGFDSSSAKVWIYPTNYSIREYQLKISEAALFKNTLVCLPTGLGKTFIASVVMYNFYRWYPAGKIVFMAPTKPLVAQQIEACYKVMGIPQAHMAELTGSTAAKHRQEVWRSKRVFFLTPQVMMNDLSRDTCPAKQIKCVVIDEAHKALGNHAYCQVIRQLSSQTLQFRVLALSATPGGDTKSVQSVISNLLISHIELRSDECPDIQAHSHQRNVEKVVVPLGEALSAHQARYLQVLEKFMSRLVQNRVMAHKDLRTLSKYQLILARDQFRKNPPPYIKGPQQGMLEGDFALCISLYHGYELLMQMGLRSLFVYFQGIMDGSREMSRAKNELHRTPTFMDLYLEMEAMFVKPPTGPDEPFIYSHPKLEKLEEVVLQHFRVWAESSAGNNGPQGVTTRVMIFSSFRESVQEIAAMLNRHSPLIRVMTFMGQASARKGVKGFTQKEQLEVVQRFRQGGFNTLVSTCVGEEGLDIGEVDLIVCFDAQKNPIRLVQRMGRTGRKRQGRIVVILAEGREEKTYNQSQSNKRSVHRFITGNKSGFHMYPNSPRMLPEGVNPTLHKMHITCGQFDHRESNRRSIRGRRSHSEGRASLIHPQNLIQQRSTTSDGFLSSTEYSLWASTMKLEEHEAHPVLRKSQFLSIPNDTTPQEEILKDRPCRELSLWEWRHWQHKALSTHAVDHSLRCNHFIKVMELIDGMKEENEGECRYEQELLPYLCKESPEKSGQKRQKTIKTGAKTTNIKPKPPRSSWSELECIDEDLEGESVRRRGLFFTSAVTEQHDTEVPCDDKTHHSKPQAGCSPSKSDSEDCAIIDVTKADHTFRDPVNPDNISQTFDRNDEELQTMFYLPKWDPAPQSTSDKPERVESLKSILANVAELLSRSPPSSADILEVNEAASLHPAPPPPHQPFPVSFSLDVDDDDDDEEMTVDNVATGPESEQPLVCDEGSAAVHSPTWDEVFEDEEVNYDNNVIDDDKETNYQGCSYFKEEDNMKIRLNYDHTSKENNGLDSIRYEVMAHSTDGGGKDGGFSRGSPQMDDSIDLFEDDEAFLQMTIPDIPTPQARITHRTSPNAKDTDKIFKSAEMHNLTKPCSTTQSADCTQSIKTEHRTKNTSNAMLITQSSHYPTETKLDIHTADTQSKPFTDHSENAAPYFKSPTPQGNSDSLNSSCELFSVNFDLGYSLEDSEDEAGVHAEPAPCMPASSPPEKQPDSIVPLPAVSNSSTPCYGLNNESKLIRQHAKSESWMSKSEALPSPIRSQGVRRILVPSLARPRPSSLKRRQPEGGVTVSSMETDPRQDSVHVNSAPHPESSSDDEDEVVVYKRRHQNKVNPMASPEMSNISSDVGSPMVVKRKRIRALNTSDEMQGEAVSDDDFQNDSTFTCRTTAPAAERRCVQQAKQKNFVCHKGRQFLDEEAELSEDEEGADMSSDEEDGEDQNRSLDGFVVDNTHLSQGLNESEMQGVYLKSVRSPAVQGKFKMSYRNHHNMDIFSQVPEMDETYAEDSFVVGSDVEEVDSNDEEAEDVELMPEASYVDGRKQYATRRRVFLHKARAKAGTKTRAESPPVQRAAVKAKRTRVIHIDDSSEDEMEEASKEKSLIPGGGVVPLQPSMAQPQPSRPKSSACATIASKVSLLSKAQSGSLSEEQLNERCRQRLENEHFLSDELDFVEAESSVSAKKQSQAFSATSSVPQKSAAQDSSINVSPLGSVCILVDSRCITSGVELMSCLRQRHAATVHVCSLDSSYFIVSNRMAVERQSQSDLAAMQNRKRLADRVNSLQELFECVCLIVEKDRSKTGETSRPFQRTRYYNSTLVALVHSGVRLLWSNSAEESAGLLADLAKLEHCKGQGITVPLEVKGQHRQQGLQLYLSLPSVNYVHALNLSHNFRSIAQLINSPIEAIQKGGCMSRSRAEEIYRFLRYSCDSFLINTSKAGKTS
ncbi:Fanconi anemia group M protein [Melanotaenia boesemani]|nr:Fanconi anemia group M protein [Melanotaenia boesemani]XP_041828194.1 Fanconi anemia group M protein [Melanotaenia boesemani]